MIRSVGKPAAQGGDVQARERWSAHSRRRFAHLPRDVDEKDNVIDFEAITIHGPHPGFSAEGDFFCDTLVPALGLD